MSGAPSMSSSIRFNGSVKCRQAALLKQVTARSRLPSGSSGCLARTLRDVLLIACIFVFAAASDCGSAERPADWQPSMQAEAWDFWFSPRMPEHPMQVGRAGPGL